MGNSLQIHTIIKEEHERKWVALSRDKTRVVAFDEDIRKLKEKVGAEKVVYMKVPPSEVVLSF